MLTDVVRRLIPILGITFVDILGFSMLIPMLPYFVTHFGAKAIVVGAVFATFSLCQVLTAPLWGSVSDRIGRKFVLVTSQIGSTIGWVMLAFAPNIAWVFVARIVEGVSGGNIGITQAYVADLVKAKDRSRAFALIGATFGAAMAFGPAIGGILFMKYGYSTTFLVAAALQLLTLILTTTLLPESRKGIEREHLALSDYTVAFHRPGLARVLIQRLANSLAMYGWYAVFALFLQRQLGFTLAKTDFFFAGFAVASVITNTGGVGTMRRMGDLWMSNLGLICLFCAFVLVAFVHNTAELAGLLILFSFGSALAQNGITAMISNAVHDREQGTILSVGSSLDSLSGILAPPASTGLLGAEGPTFAGAISAAFSLVALLIGLGAAGRRRLAGFVQGGEEPAP
jgi:DHA1 family tetracycline resistance protein-like MFS transporter